jgi:phage baseplate assembly protein W
VPYERLKGLSAGLIDRPSTTVTPAVIADVEWTLSTYEPRVDVDNVDIENLLTVEGQFGLNVGVNIVGGTL